jgi:hypothetical protein
MKLVSYHRSEHKHCISDSVEAIQMIYIILTLLYMFSTLQGSDPSQSPTTISNQESGG